MRRLTDEMGAAYEVPESALYQQTAGPTKTLYDTSTGERFDIPLELFPKEQKRQNVDLSQEIFSRNAHYQERLIQILLEECTLKIPEARERVELLVGPILAIGKVSSQEEYQKILMEIENLIRALYISNAITEDDSIHLLDQIEFFARWQLRRSITFDGKPNEREWLTVQSIHQKSELVGNEEERGGLMMTLSKLFGRG